MRFRRHLRRLRQRVQIEVGCRVAAYRGIGAELDQLRRHRVGL